MRVDSQTNYRNLFFSKRKNPDDDDDDDDEKETKKPKPKRKSRASLILKKEKEGGSKGKQTKKQKAEKGKPPAKKTAVGVSHRCPTCLNVCDGGFAASSLVSPLATTFTGAFSAGRLQLTLSKKQWGEILAQANVVVSK